MEKKKHLNIKKNHYNISKTVGYLVSKFRLAEWLYKMYELAEMFILISVLYFILYEYKRMYLFSC